MRHREAVEGALFARVSGLFGLDWSVTLYDLTNTYFEGEAASNAKAQRGHSKEKRSDCPLLTLGLVLDGSGFVRRTEVFDGNVVEGTTLAGMLQRLRAPAGALVVMDRGIATEENLLWLREQGYRYLVVSRERHRQFDPNESSDLQTASGERVSVQRVEDAEGQEVRLYCYSFKSELGLRPIFHHKEERSEGHLFITVLAYQFVQLIRRHLHAQGINDSWAMLRETLAGQVRVTATFRRPDGRALHVRKATEAETGQMTIYQALGVDPSPGGVSKMFV